MPHKIMVMNLNVLILGERDYTFMEHGLAYEKFLYGPSTPIASVSANYDQIKWPTNRVIGKVVPVHIHAARDHLVLTNPNNLDIQESESKALFSTAQEVLAELSQEMIYSNPSTWYIEASALRDLSTVSIEQALDRNIDLWMPKDCITEGLARRWRKYQNEIQMLWHEHPVNLNRREMNLPAINSVWLSGIGCLDDLRPHSIVTKAPYLIGKSSVLEALCHTLKKPLLHEIPTGFENHGLVLLDTRSDRFESLWSKLFTFLIANQLSQITLIDFPNNAPRIQTIQASDLQTSGTLWWKKKVVPTYQQLILSHAL